eukprot:jgi/Tetstr1/460950/TSEL_006102.t1
MNGLKRLEWNPATTIEHGETNDASIKQLFDAGQGNLVTTDMSEHHENIAEAERSDLLGDWEATRSVGVVDMTWTQLFRGWLSCHPVFAYFFTTWTLLPYHFFLTMVPSSLNTSRLPDAS